MKGKLQKQEAIIRDPTAFVTAFVSVTLTEFQSLLEQKGFSVSRRQNTSTTYEMVTYGNSSTIDSQCQCQNANAKKHF